MKKRYILFVALLLMCTLAACSGDRGNETFEPEEDTVQQTDPAVMDESQMESQAAWESHTEADTPETEENRMKITAGDTTFTASLADKSSAEALPELHPGWKNRGCYAAGIKRCIGQRKRNGNI